ncbi:MFS transporter [Opitutus terrae]|uniref:Major facilitator superfamily MFS_1 n=1 Tax=Opitutus terrae (strain DSM 11246 / JCM 15787 / PB90-1) TaxID=452637 RepID=B1ZRA2_OPITP|nr:MFS transporter [Opitutus terrae]ACB74589.1 major facilitator superfamily MFS_1 [Opitutus terrae PB90-1]
MLSAARASLLLLPIIYLGYISLGLPDGTLGVAWPQMHRTLALPIGLAGVLGVVGLLLTAFSGFSSGRIIARFRTGPVMLVSCVLTASGMMLFSHAPNFGWLLLAVVPLGLGAGAVDAGLNGYVARHYTGRHMNWLHACWGIGATCGPLLMARALTTAGSWRTGFAWLGTAQFSLALVFLLSFSLWNAVPERSFATSAGRADRAIPTLHANSRAGWLSAVIFALYVAAEGTAGLWAGSILAVGRGFAVETAGLCASAFYGAITAGRIFVGFVVEKHGNRRLIAWGLGLAAVGALLFLVASTPPLAALALILLGLGFAPVYPCLMHEVPRRFAPESVQTVIGRQSGAASIGGAVMPALAGSVAEFSLEGIPWMIVTGLIALAFAIRWLNRLS